MENTKEGRLSIANQMIKIISDHGRRFFFNKEDDFVAHFKLKRGCVYFVDSYTKKEIYLHYRYWGNGFTNGGTLRHLVQLLKEYIVGEKDLPLHQLGPWPITFCEGDLWGYGDSMELVREQCSKLIK